MKTALILSLTQGEGHGAEQVLEHLLRHWTRDAWELVVAAPEGSSVLRTACEEKHRAMALSCRRDSWIRNLAAVWRQNPDMRGMTLIHAWSARSFEAALLTGRRCRMPVTGTLHDAPEAFFHGRIRRWLMRACANRMTRVAFVSRALAAVAFARGYRSPGDVILNGLPDAPRHRVVAPRVRIGFLGMYAPRFKGVSMVRDWIQGLSGSNVEWRLYGKEMPAPEDRWAITTPDVIWGGRRPTEDIFPEIDILVHTSPTFDPLPTVLIEAARAGIPAVCSGLGGGSEIVRDGETGFVFDPAIPETGRMYLHRLIDDTRLRNAMGAAARRRFESDFLVSSMTRAYADFWNTAAQQGASSLHA